MDLSTLSRETLVAMKKQLTNKFYDHPSGAPGLDVLKLQLDAVRKAMIILDEQDDKLFDEDLATAMKVSERKQAKQRLIDLENECNLNSLENQTPEC